MGRLLTGSLIVALLFIVAGCDDSPEQTPQPMARATILIDGGDIITGDDAVPVVGAIAVGANGTVLATGASRADVSELLADDVTVIDLAGATAYPGFTDSHMHLVGVGERELSLNLEGLSGVAELQARLAARVALAEPGEWVVARGWIETHWEPAVFPTRADLDAVAPANPVVLERADGHALVANSRALAAGGVTADRPDPFGGAILRNAGGELTGMLVDNARTLVTRMIPNTAEIPLDRALDAGIARSLSMGWSSLHIADATPALADALISRCRAGALPLRTVLAVEVTPDNMDGLLAYVVAHREGCAGRVQIAAIKVSVDGALGSRGAALLVPYADADNDGLLMWTEGDLDHVYAAARDAGLQVWTHAIGDRANRWVLDRYEHALAGDTARRWRIEHAQHLSEQDIPRFAALGVIPSMQPSHAIGDLHFAPGRVGMARLAYAYAWRSVLDSGAIIPAGTDAPVEAGDPRVEYYAAIARADLQGYQGEGWHPEQAMTREQALAALTRWPAYAAFREGELGCLMPGCRADLTVLGGDLLTVPASEIPDVPVLMTIVDGAIVWEKD